jgi:GT2 family glycosyltransferase
MVPARGSFVQTQDQPRVCVGVVTYNSLSDLPNCFEALFGQTDANLEVVVWDNASMDGCVTWLQEQCFPIRLMVSPRNVGFAQAHNQILKTCRLRPGEYYMPLNPDVSLEPDYIASALKLFEKPDVGWVTGKLLLPDKPGTDTKRIYSTGHALHRNGYAVNIGYDQPDMGQFDCIREVFGAPSAASIISRAMIASLATGDELFDTDMFLYGEDTDLDWRARRAGWRCLYTPYGVATHRGSQPGRTLRIQAIGNRYLSVIKNAYVSDLLLYNLPLMAAHCALRMLFTPRAGLQLVRQLRRLGPVMWRKRQQPKVARHVMLDWFRWSAAQPTGQPAVYSTRFQAFMADILGQQHWLQVQKKRSTD